MYGHSWSGFRQNGRLPTTVVIDDGLSALLKEAAPAPGDPISFHVDPLIYIEPEAHALP